jgi:hypothetical protein
MLPRIAYRQFHDQTNTATVAMVLMAEFGLAQIETGERRQELTLHGMIQSGLYAEDRGLLLRNALRYVSDAGLKWTPLQDGSRTASVQSHLQRWVPDFEFRFAGDLGSPCQPWPHLDVVFSDEARLLLVDARHSVRGLPVHLLLVRREGDRCFVMNSQMGRDHECSTESLSAHLGSPVGAGAVGFAGLQYLFTGVGIRVWR